MNTALAAPAAIALMASAASGSSLADPIKWNIRARIVEVIGSPPAGALEGIGVDWTVDIEATVVATTPEPDPDLPFGQHQLRLLLADQFSIDFESDDGSDGYLLVGPGAEIDGAYLPRNTEEFDSADYSFNDLPLRRERGGVEDGTFDVVFGFFGEDGLLASNDDFLSRPDIEQTLGTGFFVYFENGAIARGELEEWRSVIVPAPGAAGLFGLGALAVARRRR